MGYHIIDGIGLVHLIIYSTSGDAHQQHPQNYPECQQGTVEKQNVITQGSYIRIASFEGTETAPDGKSAGQAELQLIQDDAQTVDVIAHIGGSTPLLFGRDVSLGARRRLQYHIVIGIRQSEINHLHHTSAARNHDVREFQVAMHHLLAMHILHHFEQLVSHLPALRPGMRRAEPFIQGNAINPFLHQAFSVAIHLFDALHVNHARMLNLGKDIILLMQQTSEHFVMAYIGCQRLQYPPFAITLGTNEDIKATNRNFLHFRETGGSLTRRREIESRNLFHTAKILHFYTNTTKKLNIFVIFRKNMHDNSFFCCNFAAKLQFYIIN